eukprot:12149402-Ditylum_brightwellii.AAC.1
MFNNLSRQQSQHANTFLTYYPSLTKYTAMASTYSLDKTMEALTSSCKKRVLSKAVQAVQSSLL